MKVIYEKYNTKPVRITLVVILIFILTVVGFGTTVEKVTSCRVDYSSWVTAEYSELVTELNFEGDLETSIDRWSESASDKYSVTTLNNNVEYKSGYFKPILTSGGYYISPMPERDYSMKNDRHFDNFREHRSSVLTVYTESLGKEKESNDFREPADHNTLCMNKLKKVITVNTWYGITYSSDF